MPKAIFRTGSVALGLLLAGLACPAHADETEPPAPFSLSGGIDLLSDFRDRGLSASSGVAAIQGWVQLDTSAGFYGGVWTTSLKQDPIDLTGKAEIDLYAGWTGDVVSGVTADMGMVWSTFPDGSMGDANFFEPYASVRTTIGPVLAKAGVNYNWRQDALGGESNLYLYTFVETAVPGTPLTASAQLGYTDGALSPYRLTASGTKGGFDYSVGVSASVSRKVTIGFTYVGVDGASIKGLSDDTVMGSLRFSF